MRNEFKLLGISQENQVMLTNVIQREQILRRREHLFDVYEVSFIAYIYFVMLLTLVAIEHKNGFYGRKHFL